MSDSAAYRTLAVRLRSGSSVPKHLYIKAHSSKDGDDSMPKGQALFVAGLPMQLDESRLQELFGVFGPVTMVLVHPKRTSGIVVYRDVAGRGAALAAGKTGIVIDFPCDSNHEDGPSTGLRKKVEDHKALYPGNAKLQTQLDEWMASFEEEEDRKRKEAENAAAEDGWTLVTKGAGRKRKSGNTVSGGISQAAAQAQAARKKPKEVHDFYRFQARDKKKSELVELRTKFAAAQKHLQQMRTARRFEGE